MLLHCWQAGKFNPDSPLGRVLVGAVERKMISDLGRCGSEPQQRQVAQTASLDGGSQRRAGSVSAQVLRRAVVLVDLACRIALFARIAFATWSGGGDSADAPARPSRLLRLLPSARLARRWKRSVEALQGRGIVVGIEVSSPVVNSDYPRIDSRSALRCDLGAELGVAGSQAGRRGAVSQGCATPPR